MRQNDCQRSSKEKTKSQAAAHDFLDVPNNPHGTVTAAIANVPKHQCIGICGVILLGLLVVGGLSGSSWYMNYKSAATSLEHLGFEFMEKVPLYFRKSFEHRLDPIRIHLTQGLKFLHANDADVTKWSGIKMARLYTTTFLLSFFEDNKCCFGIFSNMGLGKEEVASDGGWQQWLDKHKTDFGNDKAIFDRMLVDTDPGNPQITTVTAYANKFTEGNNENPILGTPLHIDTLKKKGTGDQDWGFMSFPHLDGYTPEINPNSGWWRTVHIYDMLPGDFRFTPIFVWTETEPICLKIMGVVPLYKNTAIPNEEEKAKIRAGELDWGPRVGAWVVGFKLWFLSEYLASLELKGGSIFLVERATSIVIASSDTSYILLGPSNLPYITKDNPNEHIRSASAVVAPDGDWTKVQTMDPVEKDLEGKLHFIQTFSFNFHGLDVVGVYTVPRDNMLADLDKKTTETAATSVIVNSTFCGIMLAALFCWGIRHLGRLYQAERAQQREAEKRVLKAAGAAITCRFSMVMVNLRDFREHGRLLSHELVAERGELLWLHDYETAKEFLSDYVSIFFSHQWLGWVDPDENVEQYPLMVKAAEQFAEANGKPFDEVWLWVDYVSIPQVNDYMKLLAVETLHVYVTLCEVFIIVAPPCMHRGSLERCDRETYFTRGWCRLEQYTRITAFNGINNMYICAALGDMKQVCDAGLTDALSVMSGNFSCCQRGHPKGALCDKHRVIDTMLGLYITASRERDQSNSTGIWQFLQQKRSSIYPDPLFGTLTHVADHMLREGLLVALEAVKPDESIVSQESDDKKSRPVVAPSKFRTRLDSFVHTEI